MTLSDQQAQLVKLVAIRERRIDRAVAILRQRQQELALRQVKRANCEGLINKLNDELRELRLAKTHGDVASAAAWAQQEHYGLSLQHRLVDQRTRLIDLEREIKDAESALDQAKQQLRAMRQKQQALSLQSEHICKQVRREKGQTEQRKQDEQAQGAKINGGME